MISRKKKRKQKDFKTGRYYINPVKLQDSAVRRFIHKKELVVLVFYAFLVSVVYSASLNGFFTFDDFDTILNNSHIRVTELSIEGLKKAAFESPLSRRPIANLSFAFNYYFHQYHPAGYHIMNILIHIATGIFLYFLFKTTLLIMSEQALTGYHKASSNVSYTAFFAALIWLLHPIQTQSVTYIVQRMNSMAAMFYILSLLLYIEGRLSESVKTQVIYFCLSLLTGLLALGSKETAITLPFCIILYEWFFFQQLSVDALKRYSIRFLGITVIVVLIIVIYLDSHPVEAIMSGYTYRDFTLTERLMTQSRVVVYYLGLLVFPHPSRLNLDHDFPISHSLMDPVTTLFSIAAIAGLFVLAVYTARRHRLLSFCILWFFGNLAVESSVINLEIIFEHRVYLPSMFIVFAVVILADRHIKQHWLKIITLFIIILQFSFWTYQRNHTWGNVITLWEDCAAKSPNKARPHNMLGLLFAGSGKLQQAVFHYNKAVQIKPDYADAYNNLGNAFKRLGMYDEAVNQYLKAIQIQPHHVKAHYNLAGVLARQKKIEDAVYHYSMALKNKPDYINAHYNLGTIFGMQGNIEKAMFHFSKTLQLDPGFAAAYNNMGLLFFKQENLESAIELYAKAIQIQPDYAKAHFNIAVAFAAKYEIERAINHFLEAIRINPDFINAYYRLGLVFEQQDNINEAVYYYSKAIQLKPDFAEAYNRLGSICTITGDFQQAIDYLLTAAAIRPDYADAYFNLGIVFEKQDNIDGAINYYRQVLKINPESARAHNRLGGLLIKQGHFEDAIIHFSELVRIEPENINARNKLDMTIMLLNKSNTG